MPCGSEGGFYCRKGNEKGGEGRERDQPLGTGTAEEKEGKRGRERRWEGNPTNMQHIVAAAEDAICQDPKGRANTEA